MTKEKELSMNQTFRQFMDAGLGLGSADVLNDIVNDKMMGFGTTIDEKIFNLDELKALIARQKEQSKDIDLNWEIKPLSHYTSTDENTAFFADELLLHATIGGESIEMYLRFSVVLSYVNNEWKVIHWHGSKPENVESEKDTWGIETWKEKAEALEKLVEERTADLKEKNRELEIEASLERIRSTAMGMQQPEDLLKIAEILFKELQSVGFQKLRNALIHTFNDEEKYFTDYDYSEFTGGYISRIPYSGHPAIDKFIKEVRSSRDAFTEITITGKELEDWRAFRKTNNEAPDTRLDETSALYYYFYSVGPADIGISTFMSISVQEQELLKRYRNVFDLAYRRYLDIEQAMAQTREAQIEAALEKVRSRSLAMHKSDELNEVVAIVFEKLKDLHISTTAVGISLPIKGSKDLNAYVCGEHESGLVITNYRLPSFDNVISNNLSEALQSQPDVFVGKYSKEEKNSFYEYLFEHSDLRQAPDDIKNMILQSHTYTITMVAFKHALFNINDFEGKNLTGNEVDLIKRFANVFDQAYTRFLDLLKAEAQARESQIEAAVERVRAQSMAMHHPDDLDKVNKEILTQLNWLQIQGLSGVAFYLVDEDGWVKAWDFASPGNIGGQINYAYQFDFNRYEMLGYPFKMLQQTDLDYFVCDFPLEEIQKAVFEFEEIDPTIATVVKDALSTGVLTHQWTACARIFNGMLGIDLVSPPNEDTKAIVLKMAGAFNQAYTRFLDLQKAEAQAREAEINLAVERVRAKALAMQHSAEIIDVVIKLKDEVMGLHIPNVIAATIFLKESDDKVRMWDLSSLEKNEEAYHQSLDITFKVKEKDPHLYVKRVWENGADFFVEIQDGKGFKRLMAWLREQDRSDAADDVAAYLESSQLKQLYHVGKRLNNGKLVIDLLDPPEAEVETILTKMGAAFDLAYKRFEDLQNSEDQLREAKIEAALEKVRSRSLAMHSSQELGDVIAVVLEKLQELGFVIDSGAAAHINIFSEGTRDFIQWSAAPDQAAPICSKVPYTDNNLLSDFFDAKEKGLDFFAKTYSFEEKNTWFDYAFEHSDFKYLPDDLKKVLLESKDYAHWMAIEKNSCIVINSVSGNTLSQNQIEIQKRFAKVFEQSYVRFLDLQKAEAQARDGQIELALERVRARTMAMQKSDELKDVIGEVFDQFVHLEIHIEHTGFILDYKERNDMFIWLADGQEIQNQITLPYFDCAHWNSFIEAKKTGKHFFANQLNNEEKNKFYTDLFQLVPGVPEEVKDFYFEAPGLAISTVLMENVGLYIENFNGIPYTEEENEILKRFGNVFQQAYTRFLDLQKAEAQTKEAQIELSLERIRAKVTAMQRSTDLLDIVVTMRREFVSLGHEAHYFWHMRWLPDTYEKAMTSGDGSKIGMVMQLPRHIHGDIKLLADWEATDEPTVVMAMDGETAAGYVHKMISLGDFEQVDPNAPTLDDIRNIGGLTFIMSRTTHGEIGYSLPGCVPDPPAEGIATINRFAAVFDLAYRRFEDLQSSEKRIREAQIELAIERVRAQTLAMHKSEELANLSLELVKQVQTLGVNTWFCAFNIYDEDSQDSIEWGSNGQGTFPKYRTPREGIFLRYYQAGQNNEALFINEIGEDECPAHYEYLCTLPGVGEQLLKMKADGIPFPTSQIDHVAFFKYGYIIFITYEPVPESHVIFKRFAKVFEQTYSRFLDLQKAEAQAREAEIQLALERVRARSLAMHHTSELQDIVNEVARQLQQMGMNIDGGVFIAINEEINDHIELWASAGAADYVQKVRVPFLDRPIFIGLRDAIKNGNDLFNKIFSKEEKDEMFHHLFQFDPWSKLPEERKEDLLSREGGLTRTAAIGQYTSVVITNYHGIAFTDAEIEVLKRFNIVFEQSYIRFRDLQKAEQLAKQAQIDLENLIAAKKKTEETLTELKATQSQLIQSEKMASLGELTAGIAHEIQNPLNFVNNFSEVSKELLDEMKDALENGDAQEAKDLATDIIQNLEKITHHGKRADAIVKGMLQHSRSSSSQKEPANINTLTDEYLRLAYHGLRAKDKSFNATLKTDYDVSIGMVHIISQDMGRVILNLITNAFYAVTEKKKQGEENYEPTVSVGTKNRGSNIEIAVKDNGNGIPQNILDKIFQPFFTTKPTGEGTGLGLSLAYDIVKTHGGELTVDTKPGDGTTFKITIPVLKS